MRLSVEYPSCCQWLWNWDRSEEKRDNEWTRRSRTVNWFFEVLSNSIFRQEMRKASPGDLCDVHTVCTNGSYCSAFGFCNCPEGYSEVYSLCIVTIKVRMPGDQCSPDDHICTGDSWCRENKCRCLNGYEPFRGRCRHNYLQVNANETMKTNQVPVHYHWRR